MELQCDISIGEIYKSAAQRSRVISEHWLSGFGYCLACRANSLSRTSANTRATDFRCNLCGHAYELKTFSRRPAKRLVDGAYSALLSRIESHTAPTILLLERSSQWNVRNLSAIHWAFLTPSIIEKRKPLGPLARRAGWIGCNIRLDYIARDGEIYLVQDGHAIPHDQTRHAFERVSSLSTISADKRSWTNLTLLAIRKLSVPQFTLDQLYQQEGFFAEFYPNNRNIRAKIRQQLQVLRDARLLEFEGHGQYRVTL